jgi:hypothetical protein
MAFPIACATKKCWFLCGSVKDVTVDRKVTTWAPQPIINYPMTVICQMLRRCPILFAPKVCPVANSGLIEWEPGGRADIWCVKVWRAKYQHLYPDTDYVAMKMG